MRKLYILGLIALVATIIGLAWAEEVTITTYYPAPYGVYNQLVTNTLGVGDNDGDGGLDSDDAPDPGTDPGDVWIEGNVGIGITDPRNKLHVIAPVGGGGIQISGPSGASSNDGELAFSDDYNTSVLFALKLDSANNRLHLWRNIGPNEIMTWERLTGNVGIGTVSPGSLLHVQNDSNTRVGYFAVGGSGHPDSVLRIGIGGSSYPTDIVRIFDSSGSSTPNLLYIDGATSDFIVKNNGNVGIGTADPGNIKLNVLHSSNAGWTGMFKSGDADVRLAWEDQYGYEYGIFSQMSSTATNSYLMTLKSADTTRFIVRANGNVGIATASPGSTLTVAGTTWCTSGVWDGSDIRWKKNVETLASPLEKVLKLRGIRFDWKREEFEGNNFPEGRQIGIIAQELEKEFPELVTTDEDGYKAIAYDRLTAVLLEAIKAQHSEIEGLRQEISELKREL